MKTAPCAAVPGRPAISGKKRVGVEVKVNAGDALVINPYYAGLVDSEDRVYTAVLWGCEPQLKAEILQAGTTRRGWFNFEIDEDAEPASFQYSPPDRSRRPLHLPLAQSLRAPTD